MIDNNNTELSRVWKEFGKQTEAGKLLYDLYGVRFRPEKFVNYPKLVPKSKPLKSSDESDNIKLRNKSGNNFIKAVNKINYPERTSQHKLKYNKVDLIPKRKKENVIKKEIEDIKNSINKNLREDGKKIQLNRKQQIHQLQDDFLFQERMVMPKGARLPGIKSLNDPDHDSTINLLQTKNFQNKFSSNNRLEELKYLYKRVLNEIDDRYSYMDEMKKLGKNVDLVVMPEIKERLDELKKLQKMIDDYERKNNI